MMSLVSIMSDTNIKNSFSDAVRGRNTGQTKNLTQIIGEYSQLNKNKVFPTSKPDEELSHYYNHGNAD